MREITENIKKSAGTEIKDESVKTEDEQSTEFAIKNPKNRQRMYLKETIHIYLNGGDGSLYTGWTNDIAARLEQHRSGKGEIYPGRGPLELVYLEVHDTRSEAMSGKRGSNALPDGKNKNFSMQKNGVRN